MIDRFASLKKRTIPAGRLSGPVRRRPSRWGEAWQPLAVAGLLLILPASASSLAADPAGNLVLNGSFEQDADRDGVPDEWRSSGGRQIRQCLSLDSGRKGGRAAKLVCTHYVGGAPDSHAMICQVGKVTVRGGQWYRLTFWTRGSGIKRRTCQVAISNTRLWQASGIAATFAVSERWRRVELLCRAERDVPAETSRLQFWFQSTGTLWLDDVRLEPVSVAEQLYPAIDAAGGTNPIPNSSFECGPAGWGSYSTDINTWAGNLYRREGCIEERTAWHGRHSLRISIDAHRPLTFYWDYFEPVVQPVRCVLAAHIGWLRLEPGQQYVFSCYARADRPGVPLRLLVHQHGGGPASTLVRLGTDWQRCPFRFKARGEYVWLAAGPDLNSSQLAKATVWLDAFQLERGMRARPYRPRAELETGITCPADRHVFIDPQAGFSLTLHLWNGTAEARAVSGWLRVTDFFDREVLTRRIDRRVRPGSRERVELSGLLPGRRGFFRARWLPEGMGPPYEQEVRVAVIEPYRWQDSAFGMNHAFGWQFLLEQCRRAGLLWMRDWSAKWHTVEPEPGRWDFSKVDPQIERVLAARLNPLLLLPFPSATWSSEADSRRIDRYAALHGYQRRRALVACLAKDPELFRRYVAAVTKRYADRVGWFEVMNEPLYTTYAVPLRFGYKLEDYLQLLRDAYRTIKQAAPEARVIGGIGTWIGHQLVQDFIDAGGLQWCDAMDIHLYPSTIDPELYESELAATWQKMRQRGEAKPIWLTEFGCYADDDPWKRPGQIGDSAMSRANWASERAAAEALVQSAAVFLSHGVRKIFFHAGTCPAINGQNGGNVFFEYAGAPRKMYAALSALANMLGPDPQPLPLDNAGQPASPTGRQRRALSAYLFKTPTGSVAIVWSRSDEPVELVLPPAVKAFDLVGNRLREETFRVAATPVFLQAPSPRALTAVLHVLSGDLQ